MHFDIEGIYAFLWIVTPDNALWDWMVYSSSTRVSAPIVLNRRRHFSQTATQNRSLLSSFAQQ